MACYRMGGCICEGNGYCPNWVHPEDEAGLNAAYAQPAPDPHDCPHCEGTGRLDGLIRCDWCNPNVGEPRDEERAP